MNSLGNIDWSDDFEDVDDIGISWGDVGDGAKWAFGNVIHPLGKGIASAAGAGSAAQSLEDLEKKQGWLPATLSTTAASMTTAAASKAGAAAGALGKGKGGGASAPTGIAPSTTTPKAKPTAPPSWFTQHPVVAATGALSILGFLALILRAIFKKGDRS